MAVVRDPKHLSITYAFEAAAQTVETPKKAPPKKAVEASPFARWQLPDSPPTTTHIHSQLSRNLEACVCIGNQTHHTLPE